MINPVMFTIRLFGWEWPVRWYGVILMVGFVIGAWIVERELRRRGENGDLIWDAAIWVLIPGVVGARLWYVINATLGGSTVYTQNPVEILKTWNGGLHIFGAFLFGAAGLMLYLRQNKLDPWLFLDAAGPALLIGQGIGRIANFINQELYGPPTTLPWGIPITTNRLPQYSDLSKYPLETTRFHPTFAYEMLWNFATASILLWVARRYEKQIKPGTIFAGWLVAAGFGRTWIEIFFRPDQPKIPGVGISYSSVVAALMAIIGAVILLARYRAINLQAAENWEEEYKPSLQPKPEENSEEVDEDEKRVSKVAIKPVVLKKTSAGKATEKTPSVRKKATSSKVAEETSPPKKTTTQAKKSS